MYCLGSMINRATFLRMGGAAALGVVVAPAAASAQLPAPTPIGDDAGYLQFGALGERVALNAYRRAVRQSSWWSADERATLDAIVARKVLHVQQLTAALGATAPSQSDYAVTLPDGAVASRRSTLGFLEGLEQLLVGVYLGGAGFSADQGTRVLLARVLANDAQDLAVLRGFHRMSIIVGLPNPIDVDAAGDQLDKLLDPTGYPTT
jgi:hypothetical protein